MLDNISVNNKESNQNVDSIALFRPQSQDKSFLDKIGLRTKAVLFAIAISTLPVLAVGAVSYSFIEKSLKQSQRQEIEIAQSDQANANKLLWKLGIAAIVTALLSGGTATILGHRMILRIIKANDALKKLGRGNFKARIPLQGKDELTSLGANINEMAEKFEGLLRQQKQETQQLRLFTNTLIAIRQSVNTEELLNTTVGKLRQIFNADRVAIYYYGLQDVSQVLAESQLPGLVNISDKTITSQYLSLEPAELRNNQVLPINNVYDANFDAEQLLLLEQLQVKSKLTVPIFKDNVFFGYLLIHHCSTHHIWQPQEVNFIQQLALQVGLSLERIQLLSDSQSLRNLAVHLCGSWKTQDIYNLAVHDIRKAIKADRVVIYKFDEKWQGAFLAESLVAGFPCAMGVEIIEPCLVNYADAYKQGRILAINNVHQAGLSNCYLQQLELFNVKANLVAPIIVNEQLLGLLIAHQCSGPRNWQQSEIDLFQQFGRLLGLALERANLLSVSEQARVGVEDLFCEQLQQKQQRSAQLMSLLEQLEDAYVSNSQAIHDLTETKRKQTEQINFIATTTNTRDIIKTVAKNARLAAKAASSAILAAESMNSIRDTNVENITFQNTIDETVNRIKHLADDSHSIASLATLINQIAAQTNLLAINAGIEAARSDAGQGFAVAEEVAALATKCTNLSNQISSIADRIESETTELITTVESQSQQVFEDTSLMTKKANLSEITQKCGQINNLVQEIYGATASQIQASKQVATALKDLSKLDTSDYSQLLDSQNKAAAIIQQMKESIDV